MNDQYIPDDDVIWEIYATYLYRTCVCLTDKGSKCTCMSYEDFQENFLKDIEDRDDEIYEHLCDF